MARDAVPASERRVVTVLFADIAGFTAMAERLDAETVTEAVNSIFADLGAEVEAVGGYIDKVMGDSLMALFGAPVAHGDDGQRAVRAAMAMQQAVAVRQPELQRALGGPVRLRIGVHSGQVVWGAVGPPGQERPTVMGDAVNLASRLQRAAPEGGVLVSEAVWRAVRHAYEARAWEPIVIRGKAEPVAVYEIVGERPRPASMERPPFIDRVEDIAQLQDLLARARRGRAQVAIISGDPGIGKTRLAEEFVARLPGDVTLVRAACPPYGGRSLGPLSDLFRQLAGLSDPIAFEDVRARVPMGDRAAKAALILSRLFNLVEVSDAPEVSGETALLVAAEAIRLMLVRPTVVWLEDLHWADAGTREVLPFIVERLGETPLLLIGTLRTGEVPPAWGTRTPVSTLAVDPLSEDDGRALAAAILGERPPAAVERAIVEKAAGNAFYLGEIIATLRGRGTLALDDFGHWRATAPVEGVLPDTVQGAVLARLDRLAPDLRSVVQRASAVGMVFKRSLIAALCPDIDVAEALRKLEDAALLARHDPLAADPECGFVHPLVRDVAYGSLLVKHQAALHREIASALERLYPEQRDDLSKAIGVHYAQGGDPGRALPYLALAGERAARRYATREAIELLEDARRLAEEIGRPEACLEACELLGELYLRVQERGPKAWFDVWQFIRTHTDSATDPLRRARAAIRAAHALAYDRQPGDAWPYLREAEALLPPGHALWSDYYRVRAFALVMVSSFEEGLEAAQTAVEIADRLGTMADRSRAYAVLAHPALLPLLGEEGRKIMRAWVSQVAATGDERLLIEARHFLISDVWTRGILDDDLLQTMEEALRKAGEHGWTRDEASLSMVLGWAQFLIGRWPEADRLVRRAYDLVEAHGGRMGQYLILLPFFRGNLAMAAGRLTEARQVFEEALPRATYHAPIFLNHDLAKCLLALGDEPAARESMQRSLAARDRFRCVICGCQANGVAAEFYATVGDADLAEHLAHEAETTARRIRHVATLVRAHRARAHIAIRRGVAPEAIGAARRAMEIAGTLPIPQPFESGQTLLLLGAAYEASGDRPGAIAAWQEARAIFNQLGAAWHLARADDALSRARAAAR